MLKDDLKEKCVLFFAPETLPSMAGAGINAYAFASFISKYARTTQLCCLNYNNSLPKYEPHGQLIIKRLPYYKRSILHKLFSFPFLLLNYYRNIRHFDIIMVYSGYLIGFQFIIWISRILKRKVIFRSTLLHGDDPETLLSKNLLMRSLNKFVLNQLNIYFAINPVFADQFRTLLGNKIQIVNLFQGIDSKRFYPSSLQHKNQIRKKIQIPSNELVLLSVGILLKKKGYEKVFPLLTTLDIPFIYVVVGEYLPDQVRNLSNEEMKEMHTLFYQGKDLLGDRIRFTGPVEAIENYFHAADIFLLSSLQEGTPNVLLEALACGLPCITRSLPGISGLLTFHEKNALEFDHIRVLPQLIKDLADHPQKMKNIGMNASETIHENYTFERIADKLFSSLNG